MYTLYNLELGTLLDNISSIDAAYDEFIELVAYHGDLPSTTIILDSLTGEIITTIAE